MKEWSDHAPPRAPAEQGSAPGAPRAPDDQKNGGAEATPAPAPAVEPSGAPEACSAPGEPTKGPAAPAPAPVHKLAFQSMAPTRDEHFVGNEAVRQEARRWLLQWRKAPTRRQEAARAMLLFYGPPGSGKTVWAKWILIQADFELRELTPSQVGAGRQQTPSAFLRAAQARPLSGKPLAVLLEDVEELFRRDPAAAKVPTTCPIIACAGPCPPRELRIQASKNLHFKRLLSWEATRLARRFLPDASDRLVQAIVADANGDLRQLQLRCDPRQADVRRAALAAADAMPTPYDTARLALHDREHPLPLRGPRDVCRSREDVPLLAQLLILENFPRACGGSGDPKSLDCMAGFMADACRLSTYDAACPSGFDYDPNAPGLHLLPLVARRWLKHLPAGDAGAPIEPLGPHTQELAAQRRGAPKATRPAAAADRSEGAEKSEGAEIDREPPIAAEQPRREWRPPPPRFRKGLQLAASLLQACLGDAGLAEAAALQHPPGAREEAAFLSAPLRLAAATTLQVLEDAAAQEALAAAAA